LCESRNACKEQGNKNFRDLIHITNICLGKIKW
jgi:hypothetical protein